MKGHVLVFSVRLRRILLHFKDAEKYMAVFRDIGSNFIVEKRALRPKGIVSRIFYCIS